MLIMTRDFGEQEFHEDELITFPKGIFAFEEYTRFLLIKPLEEPTAPMWLQSAEDSALCFIVFSPTALFDDYHPVFEDEELADLEFTNEQDLILLSIAIIPEDYSQTTVNLKSPIVLNTVSHRAKQVILSEDYLLRAPIFTGVGE